AVGSSFASLLGSRPGIARPALLLAATLLSHVFFGLYAGISGLVMVVTGGRGAGPRAHRLAAIWAVAFAVVAFWLVPFALNAKYQGGLPWKYGQENGLRTVELAKLWLSGWMLDAHRLPWLTVLVIGGGVLAIRRRAQPLDRWLLVLLASTCVLLLGRSTFGRIYDRIPFHEELQVIRYLCGL